MTPIIVIKTKPDHATKKYYPDLSCPFGVYSTIYYDDNAREEYSNDLQGLVSELKESGYKLIKIDIDQYDHITMLWTKIDMVNL